MFFFLYFLNTFSIDYVKALEKLGFNFQVPSRVRTAPQSPEFGQMLYFENFEKTAKYGGLLLKHLIRFTLK